MNKFTTNSAKETQKLAEIFAEKFKNGAIITLNGPLGAGKTTFVQGFAKKLGIKNKIISPTFVLMREYDLPYEKNAKLFHIDLYRLEGTHQIDSLGLSDLFENCKNIFLIEWAEKLVINPKNKNIKVNFEYLSKNSRQITVIDRLTKSKLAFV